MSTATIPASRIVRMDFMDNGPWTYLRLAQAYREAWKLTRGKTDKVNSRILRLWMRESAKTALDEVRRNKRLGRHA